MPIFFKTSLPSGSTAFPTDGYKSLKSSLLEPHAIYAIGWTVSISAKEKSEGEAKQVSH